MKYIVAICCKLRCNKSIYVRQKGIILHCSILVMWLGCRFHDAQVDGSNPGSISMLCH